MKDFKIFSEILQDAARFKQISKGRQNHTVISAVRNVQMSAVGLPRMESAPRTSSGESGRPLGRARPTAKYIPPSAIRNRPEKGGLARAMGRFMNVV